MATLLILAPELIHRIADHMKTQDVKCLRLACKQLGEYLESKVLSTVLLTMNKRDVTQSTEMLHWLATCNLYGAVSRCARRLLIGSLSPIHGPNCWISEVDDVAWAGSPKCKLGPENSGEHQEFRKALTGALLSLQNIHSVIWRIEYDDAEWAQTIVVSALVAMPHLQRLDAMLAYSLVPLPLQDMRSLREIRLSDGNTPSNGLSNSQTFVNLAALISQSPPGQLTHIQASRGYYDTIRTDARPSLHDLLASYPDDKQPLRLRHLGITNAFIKLDERTIPHLRHLSSLDLSNVLQPREHTKRRRSRFRMMSQPIDPTVYKNQRTVGSTVDEIWVQLSQLEIWLEQITISEVVPAFLEYLESYSGLKMLSLRVRGVDTAAESNTLAQSFFEQAIPRHVGSLEELMIEAPYEGLWCFGDHNLSVISACTRLKHLKLTIVTEPTKDVALRSIKTVEDAIDTLIDITSMHMPQLIDIRLHVANLEQNRRSFCGTGALQHYSSARKRIADYIYRYSVSMSTHPSIPVISVGPNTFEPGRLRPSGDSDASGGGEWQWRYKIASAETGCPPGIEKVHSDGLRDLRTITL